jgi:hypothetical protein
MAHCRILSLAGGALFQTPLQLGRNHHCEGHEALGIDNDAATVGRTCKEESHLFAAATDGLRSS